MVAEVAARQQVHHQVQVLAVLEGVVHVHQKRTVQESQDLAFVHHGLHAPLRQDSGLVHLLHCVDLPVLLVLNLPDFAETSLADANIVVE